MPSIVTLDLSTLSLMSFIVALGLVWFTLLVQRLVIRGTDTVRNCNSKFVGLAFGAGLAFIASTTAASAGNVNLFDGTFGSGTVGLTFAPPGDTVSSFVCPSCGDPGFGLQTNVQNISNSDTSKNGGIGIFDNALTYNPAAQGSIISFSASADKSNTSTTGNAFPILIEQGGNYYLDSVSEPIVAGFQHLSVTGLTASDFSQICLVSCGSGNYANPANFSLSGDTAVALNLINGGQIEFGVLVTAHPAIGATNTQIYDNLDFSLTATPLPSTWTMLLAGFVGFGFLTYRGTKKGTASLAAA